MAVGTHQRVRKGQKAHLGFRGKDNPGQILEVDLMNDPGGRRNHLEIVEGGLAPLQELIALTVALKLPLDVDLQGRGSGKRVHLHGMVDNQLRRDQGIDLPGISSQPRHGFSHGRQVDDRRNACEVLEHHSCRREGDLLGWLCLWIPLHQRLDVLGGDRLAIFVAQQVFEQNPERERKPVDFSESLPLQRWKAVVAILLSFNF